MTEAEVRGLCIKSREIFLSQPILLELEAPLKICGQFQRLLLEPPVGLALFSADLKKNCVQPQVTSMDSTQICWDSLSTAASLQRPTTFSWGTTWTEGSSLWRPSAFYSPTRSSTLRTSSCSEATTSAPLLTASTASTTSVSSLHVYNRWQDFVWGQRSFRQDSKSGKKNQNESFGCGRLWFSGNYISCNAKSPLFMGLWL